MAGCHGLCQIPTGLSENALTRSVYVDTQGFAAIKNLRADRRYNFVAC